MGEGNQVGGQEKNNGSNVEMYLNAGDSYSSTEYQRRWNLQVYENNQDEKLAVLKKESGYNGKVDDNFREIEVALVKNLERRRDFWRNKYNGTIEKYKENANGWALQVSPLLCAIDAKVDDAYFEAFSQIEEAASIQNSDIENIEEEVKSKKTYKEKLFIELKNQVNKNKQIADEIYHRFTERSWKYFKTSILGEEKESEIFKKLNEDNVPSLK